MSRLLGVMNREFGWKSRLFAAIGGPYVLWKIRQEEKRLARGWTYEPPTFYEVNDAASLAGAPAAAQCRYVTPRLDGPSQPQTSPAPPPKGRGGRGRRRRAAEQVQ
jgi:hypothetical protein